MKAQRQPFFRIIDANLNRAREGIRVCEEVARFVLSDPRLTRRCQRLRHDLGAAARQFASAQLVGNRDSRRDVGRPGVRKTAGIHGGYPALVRANALRVQEAFRVLEEFTRLKSLRLSQLFGALRFRAYTLEQDILSKLPSVRHR